MQYRVDKYGNRLSQLGFGCMRFPQINGKIDIEETERQILQAVEAGVNYFDTAYLYPGSESALGIILERNCIRNKVNIATKLPHYKISKNSDFDKFFNEELDRLKTDYVDYYLIHMLTDINTWNRLVELGINKWINEKKRVGQIKQIGFSYHGNADMFIKLVDAYDWDFCQIQYNYLDINSQAGVTGLRYANSKGLPVIIMEPLRGGKLVNNISSDVKNIIEKNERHWTPAEWSFRWLWNQKEVTVVLSGMNSMAMVKENIQTASDASCNCFTKSDDELINKVVKLINKDIKVGCTGCRYCMPCPMNVDIPGIFASYNRINTDGKISAMTEYYMCTSLRKEYTGPANCIECGQCEKHCPQHIEIIQELKNACKTLENPIYRFARKLVSFFIKY